MAKRLRITVLAVLVAVALVSSLSGVLLSGDWAGLLLSFGTEMAGAVATYILLELFIGRWERGEAEREEREVEREEREADKAHLTARLGSQVKDAVVPAAEELRRRGWLHNGSLQEKNLSKANLQGVDLSNADLKGALLITANLEGTDLSGANLHGAYLFMADLQGADLAGADLQEANLLWANLKEANLSGAGLSKTNLLRADLERADLSMASFDKDTTLPDGAKWTPDTDMGRFTDPEHPNFWRLGTAAATKDGHSPRDSKADSVTYHVYENYSENKARIHFSHCRYCNYGEGIHERGLKTKNGEWHGRFATFQEALDAARGTGRNVSTCGHCNPQ